MIFVNMPVALSPMNSFNIKMNMCNTGGTSYKKHGVSFYKTRHQFIRPIEILREFWCMLKYVEEKNTPCSWTCFDHVNIIAKGLIIISGIDGRVSIAFDVIV